MAAHQGLLLHAYGTTGSIIIRGVLPVYPIKEDLSYVLLSLDERQDYSVDRQQLALTLHAHLSFRGETDQFIQVSLPRRFWRDGFSHEKSNSQR
jgi:hypothetical protein